MTAHLDGVIAILAAAPAVTLPLAELARQLGVGPDALARELDAEPRVLVLRPLLLPDLTVVPPERRAAYERALRDIGLQGQPRVALVRPPAPGPNADLGALLRDTVLRLLTPGTAPLAEAADRTHHEVRAALRGA